MRQMQIFSTIPVGINNKVLISVATNDVVSQSIFFWICALKIVKY